MHEYFIGDTDAKYFHDAMNNVATLRRCRRALRATPGIGLGVAAPSPLCALLSWGSTKVTATCIYMRTANKLVVR